MKETPHEKKKRCAIWTQEHRRLLVYANVWQPAHAPYQIKLGLRSAQSVTRPRCVCRVEIFLVADAATVKMIRAVLCYEPFHVTSELFPSYCNTARKEACTDGRRQQEVR